MKTLLQVEWVFECVYIYMSVILSKSRTGLLLLINKEDTDSDSACVCKRERERQVFFKQAPNEEDILILNYYKYF